MAVQFLAIAMRVLPAGCARSDHFQIILSRLHAGQSKVIMTMMQLLTTDILCTIRVKGCEAV